MAPATLLRHARLDALSYSGGWITWGFYIWRCLFFRELPSQTSRDHIFFYFEKRPFSFMIGTSMGGKRFAKKEEKA
ncbi:MAG: hypothetical protein ACE144_15115 [Thermodesulfobacteriota bacterium]